MMRQAEGFCISVGRRKAAGNGSDAVNCGVLRQAAEIFAWPSTGTRNYLFPSILRIARCSFSVVLRPHPHHFLSLGPRRRNTARLACDLDAPAFGVLRQSSDEIPVEVAVHVPPCGDDFAEFEHAPIVWQTVSLIGEERQCSIMGSFTK
jgi:hypothetical protein